MQAACAAGNLSNLKIKSLTAAAFRAAWRSRQLISRTMCSQGSPAALPAWLQSQGGKVEGVSVQSAGDGTGYGLWSAQVPFMPLSYM